MSHHFAHDLAGSLVTQQTEHDVSPAPGDLDEKGIAELRKVFPKAIARIEQEAAAIERRKVVEQVREGTAAFDDAHLAWLDAILAGLSPPSSDRGASR